MSYFHGGKAGLDVGDILIPSPPHVHDGCPICVARASGRTPTVGEMRAHLLRRRHDPRAQTALRLLADEHDDTPIDPPSEQKAVYITNDIRYAAWYAARSGNGDLYRVDPIGPVTRSDTDHFPSWFVDSARVVEVVRRRVRLTRTERREIMRRWQKADESFVSSRSPGRSGT